MQDTAGGDTPDDDALYRAFVAGAQFGAVVAFICLFLIAPSV